MRNSTESHNAEIKEVIDKLCTEGRITKSLSKKLKNFHPKTACIYCQRYIRTSAHPHVSANGCPTEKISALADIYLQPYLPKVRSYLRDTTQFLNKLSDLGTIPESHILGTLDVTSLYTNIPNQEGCLAIYRLLCRERTPSSRDLTNTNICQLLWFVLSKNHFAFNNNHYLQVGGTAMGTLVAPNYANLFMSDVEEKFVYSYPKQPTVWLLFIDDIFFVWPHGQAEFTKFLKHLNDAHETIKFTSEFTSVNFLDTVISVNTDRSIKTSLYVKPTDSGNYLHNNSAHPRHCIKGIPYGQSYASVESI